MWQQVHYHGFGELHAVRCVCRQVNLGLPTEQVHETRDEFCRFRVGRLHTQRFVSPQLHPFIKYLEYHTEITFSKTGIREQDYYRRGQTICQLTQAVAVNLSLLFLRAI
jgi:hypothetical protein